MPQFGMARVAVAVPQVHVANVRANVAAAEELVRQAAGHAADIVLFPELSLTGYTAADLFQQDLLLDAAEEGCLSLAERIRNDFAGLAIVGLPLRGAGRLWNAAAVLHRGQVVGIVPKTFIPTYREYYERRWFAPAVGPLPAEIRLGAGKVPFGTDLLFEDPSRPDLIVGIEICEDLWVPIPPSCHQALAGATVLLNPSASNESTGKAGYRRDLVVGQSGRLISAYAYASSGVSESTTDLVFGGHAMIAENGVLLAESKRFERLPSCLVADVDLERLMHDRRQLGTFGDSQVHARCDADSPFAAASRSFRPSFRRLAVHVPIVPTDRLYRFVPGLPFVPANESDRRDRCEEILRTQVAGLAKRLEVARPSTIHIGVSGGLDSTLALLVAAWTFDEIGRPRSEIHGLTMPGFGTTERTRKQADTLMQELGITSETIDIRDLSSNLFKALQHRPFGIEGLEGRSVDELQAILEQRNADQTHDLVFENVQARLRTLLLMSRGFVLGTGDLSELALGWATYNGDHMSMYNVNASIPKTLVRSLVEHAAEQFSGPVQVALRAILETEISPELLPPRDGEPMQSTEGTIGPYELHDFFLYHVLRFGMGPEKLRWLARHARFSRPYSDAEVSRWMRVFFERFFRNQFKRSCLPDGPKVGSVSLSPRGDWRMPSDAEVGLWIAEIDAWNDGL